MNNFNLFYDIANHPFDYARTWKIEKDRKVIGQFCSYSPEEIIFAAGALPFRIFGSGFAISKADEYLQTYCCSFVRSALADGLSGKLDFLDGTVFPHTCDSIQRLSDIWRMNFNFGCHMDVVLPVKTNTDSAREYLVNVLKKFRHDLEKNLGLTITNEALIRSAKKYNRLRSLMNRIYNLRRENPEVISSKDLHALVKASMIMDRDVLIEILPDVISTLEREKTHQRPRLKRLVLAGGICNLPDIYTIIENYGALILWDDSCSGSRYFEGDIHINGDIIESIGDRYTRKIVCPAKHFSLYARGEHLVDIAKKNNADGVIFVFLKFCDPHAFDYPYIKELLEKEGIPSMLLEIEASLPAEGQLKTRCQAFLEML